MDTRKVIKNKNSFYINIPSDVAQSLEIMKGDRLKVGYVPGCGIFITRAQGADKVPTFKVDIDRLQRAADFIYEQLKGRLKDLDSNFITGLHLRIIDDLVRSGLFELKARVDKLETKSEVSDQAPGKLVLVHKKKGSAE